MLIGGINVIKINVITLASEKGMAARNMVPMPSLEMAEATFKHIPTGGVTSPIANPVIRMTPNWMGETPREVTAGRKTGVKRRIAGLTSTKVPVIKIIALITSKIRNTGRSNPDMKAATDWGICSMTRIQM